MRVFGRLFMAAALAGLCTAAAPAQQSGSAASQNVAVTVTVNPAGKDHTPPAVPQNAVVVREDGKVSKVVSWTPAQGNQAGVDFVVLVDDSLSKDVSVQLNEIGNWLRELPAGTRVAVAYASYGSAYFTQDFTADHERAAKAFHIPNEFPGISNGVYDSLSDLIRKWPQTQNRREVLLISDGIDTTDGVRETLPSLNPVLQHTMDQAERSGVTVYTIYAAGSGRGLHNQLLVTNGQGCLAQLAAETGGEAFSMALATPLSFKPFLQKIEDSLGRQYLLTFRAEPNEKQEFARLKVTAELNGVELVAPDHVYVGGSR